VASPLHASQHPDGCHVLAVAASGLGRRTDPSVVIVLVGLGVKGVTWGAAGLPSSQARLAALALAGASVSPSAVFWGPLVLGWEMYTPQKSSVCGREVVSGLEGDLFH